MYQTPLCQTAHLNKYYFDPSNKSRSNFNDDLFLEKLPAEIPGERKKVSRIIQTSMQNKWRNNLVIALP